jgi:hypothetical protein
MSYPFLLFGIPSGDGVLPPGMICAMEFVFEGDRGWMELV